MISFLLVLLEVDSIRGSVFWLLLLGGSLPTLPPSYVVLVETPGKGQIVWLDLPEEQHKNNKIILVHFIKAPPKFFTTNFGRGMR